MVDGIFFISSALNVKQLSVFSNEERYQQTVNTIKSIDKMCPNNVKYMFDTSYKIPEASYLQGMHDLELLDRLQVRLLSILLLEVLEVAIFDSLQVRALAIGVEKAGHSIFWLLSRRSLFLGT